MTDGILKPGDPCPCCGQPIKTSDPEKRENKTKRRQL